MTWHVVSIDDLAEVGELVQMTLHHPQIILHHARDGRTGLALVRELVPDLVILDLMLPGMSGWEVYDTIRAAPDLAHIPIIILSVLSAKTDRYADFARSNINSYMVKPFDVLELRQQVGQMLRAPDLWL